MDIGDDNERQFEIIVHSHVDCFSPTLFISY